MVQLSSRRLRRSRSRLRLASGSSSPPAAEYSAGWGGECWGGQGKGKGKAPAVEEDWWKGKGPAGKGPAEEYSSGKGKGYALPPSSCSSATPWLLPGLLRRPSIE